MNMTGCRMSILESSEVHIVWRAASKLTNDFRLIFLRHRVEVMEKLFTASHVYFLPLCQFLSCVRPLCLWSTIAPVVCPLKAEIEDFSAAPPRCLPKHKVLVCIDKIFHSLSPGQGNLTELWQCCLVQFIIFCTKPSDALEATASLFAGKDPGQSSPMSDRKKNRRKKSMNQKGDAAVGQAEGNGTLFTQVAVER